VGVLAPSTEKACGANVSWPKPTPYIIVGEPVAGSKPGHDSGTDCEQLSPPVAVPVSANDPRSRHEQSGRGARSAYTGFVGQRNRELRLPAEIERVARVQRAAAASSPIDKLRDRICAMAREHDREAERRHGRQPATRIRPIAPPTIRVRSAIRLAALLKPMAGGYTPGSRARAEVHKPTITARGRLAGASLARAEVAGFTRTQKRQLLVWPGALLLSDKPGHAGPIPASRRERAARRLQG